MEKVIYMDPYSNDTKVRAVVKLVEIPLWRRLTVVLVMCLLQKALVVQGPTDVLNRELIFLQFSQNATEEDFSAISYMLFSRYTDMSRRYNRCFMSLMYSIKQICNSGIW